MMYGTCQHKCTRCSLTDRIMEQLKADGLEPTADDRAQIDDLVMIRLSAVLRGVTEPIVSGIAHGRRIMLTNRKSAR